MWVLVTQNLGKSGDPSVGTIVCSQEADILIVAKALPGSYKHWKAGQDIISWDPYDVKVDKQKATLLHKGQARFSSTRYLMELQCEIEGQRVTILNSHMINAPFARNAPNQKKRKRWWNKEYRIIKRRVIANRLLGRQVFTCGDMNSLLDNVRFGKYEVVIGRQRLDRMFYTNGPFARLGKPMLLDKVGEGRVTHNGIRTRFTRRPV